MTSARRRFRIIKEIAEGGFGKVYLAEQISSDGFSRIVAVKLLHAKWSSHDEVVMRTRDEARLLGIIRHQHIVKVEDLTSIDGKLAIVMEYLEGVDLKWMMTFLKERGMPFPRAALFECVLAVGSALDAAYNGLPLQGGEPLRVIHRDIKPSNIFVTTAAGVKVLDFGTARANFAQREAKTQALAFGSQGYMAPERMLGEEDTAAADIFSLGITLYELLTLESFGRIPPRPNKYLQKLEERVGSVVLEGDPEWCDQVRETLRLMLAYDPTERPSAAQIVEIFEVLAQNAQDMQLRRFCRTLVAEAKASEPELDTGDPLAGQVVDEDSSQAFLLVGNLGGGMAAAAAAAASNPPAGDGVTGAMPPPQPQASMNLPKPPPPSQTAASPKGSTPPAKAPPKVSNPPPNPKAPTPVPIPNRPDPVGQAAGDAPEEPQGGGGMGMGLIVGAILVLLLVGGGFVLVGVLGIGTAAVVSSGTGLPAPAPDPVPAPTPVPAKPEPKGYEGYKVVSEDKGTEKKVPTSVTFGDGSSGAQIQVTTSSGYKAEWDGKGTQALELVPTKYKTLIELPDGKKIRGASFDVTAVKKGCAFTFEAGGKDWAGECK